MFRNQLLSTKVGVLLALLLTGVALVPSFHWIWLTAKALLLLSMLFYIWRINTRDNTQKKLTLRIEGVGEEEAGPMGQRLKALFGESLTVLPTSTTQNALMVRIDAKTTLAAIARRLKKAHLPMSLMGTDGRLVYTAIAGQARMRVEVEGIASPHSKVYIADLESPATADKDGRFTVSVPFALVKQHQGRGYIPAVWRKEQISKKIRVPIPA
jgi:hypothetical protein